MHVLLTTNIFLSCDPALQGYLISQTRAPSLRCCAFRCHVSTRRASISLVPNTRTILNADLVAKQDLSATSLPSSIAGSREHEPTCWINVNSTDDPTAMPGHNREWHRLVSGFRLSEVVNAKNVLRSTITAESLLASDLSWRNAHY